MSAKRVWTILMVGAMAASPVLAGPNYWNTAISTNWSTIGNWSLVGMPASVDDVWFNAAGQNGAVTVTVDTNAQAQSLTFRNTGTTTLQNDSAQTRTLTFGDLTVVSGAGTVTLKNNTSGSLAFNLNGAGTATWTNGSGNDVSINSVIGGSAGTLAVKGTRPIRFLNQANTFTGNIVVDGGSAVLAVGDQGAISDACLGNVSNNLSLLNGAWLKIGAQNDKAHVLLNPLRTLTVSGGARFTAPYGVANVNIPGNIVGSGGLNTYAHAVQLSGSNTFAGGITFGGNLRFSSEANICGPTSAFTRYGSSSGNGFCIIGVGLTNLSRHTFSWSANQNVYFEIQDPANTFTWDKNYNMAMNSASDIAFVKTGAGTLVVTTNQSYNNAGGVGTALNGGTLKVDYATGGSLASANNQLSAAGGILYLLGTPSVAVTQTLQTVRLNAGGGAIVVDNRNGTASTTLKLGGFTQAVGSSLAIRTVNPGDGAAIVTSTQTNDATGVIGAGRIVHGSDNWACIVGGTTVGVYSAYTAGLPDSGATPTLNYNHEGSGSVTASETVNTLRLTSTGAGQSLAVADGQTLTLASGGLLFVGAQDYSITGGTLGATATNADLVISHYGTGRLVVSSGITNWLGVNALTVAGTGTVVLAGTNTYTGQTYVNGAVLSLGNANQMKNAGILNLSAGTLQVTDTLSMSRSVIIGGGGGTFDVASGKTLTLSSTVNGGNLTLANSDGGNGTLVLSGDNSGRDNMLYGAVAINGGILRLANNNALNRYGLNTLKFGPGATAQLQINGARIITVASLVSASANAVVENGAAGVAVLQVYNGAANDFAGVLQNGAAGTLAVTKAGCGALTLTGASTYTGATTVNGGALVVNGSLASAGTVTVNAGSLGGTGTVGSVTMAGGTTLAPGEGGVPGTLGVGSLTLGEGAILAYDVSAGAMDSVAVSGTLALPTNAVLALNGTVGVNSPFVLFEATGPITGSPDNWSGLPPTHKLTVSRDGLRLMLRPRVAGMIFAVE